MLDTYIDYNLIDQALNNNGIERVVRPGMGNNNNENSYSIENGDGDREDYQQFKLGDEDYRTTLSFNNSNNELSEARINHVFRPTADQCYSDDDMDFIELIPDPSD